MSQGLLILWTVFTIVVILTVLILRKRQQKSVNLELAQLISLALSTLGIVSSTHLLYKAFTLRDFQEILGADIVTLVIGAVAVIWVSAKEVVKIVLE
ncbi:hypothetical protein [Synechococcus sp. PCC 6312]|uniref:hypothetical protein n=1 Tax=Synechococcus sp. (strain ATCC 27167 / PCC 6312) TaxID=195253 RepID=UPI00029EDFAC|nr:hypothetical protein [Synechococcus sp. PCC 6312]AFY62052.1 hypothetical protein Syn6312_2995 [Synechococcus sp. PCC 6312]